MTHVFPADETPIAAVAAWRAPTRRSAMLFRAKALAHQAERGLRDLRRGLPRLAVEDGGGFAAVLGESRTALWLARDPREQALERGKVHNLRHAAVAIDRIAVPAGAVFSFWRQVGRASRRRGFVAGRMLQEGCLVPAVGGGLCQLSNALYDAALQAGCDIVERHAHSRIVPGSAAALGRDATVAWNYVDLRFRARQPMQIEARLSADELTVRLLGREPAIGRSAAPPPPARERGPTSSQDCAGSCDTCGAAGCFRHHHRAPATDAGVTAFLVDENWPEFQDYVLRQRRPDDILGLPLDGTRWHLPPRYRWDTRGFARVATASYAAASRALAVRRLPSQGPARRAAELRGAERIAARLARLLTPDVTKVCVAQSLLPFLHRDGHLGGREVEVLMTRLPIAQLQTRLDRARSAHPERATLADFRAPAWLAAAETAALDNATRIVTPHSEVARLFAGKALKLDWQTTPGVTQSDARIGRRIAFPGPTIARKGAFEVRAAARALGLQVVLCGSDLEGAEFWAGVDTLRPQAGGAAWLAGVGAVVQPAIVEDRPRQLLTALATGVPVVATAACGLSAHKFLMTVPEDDPVALIAALRRVLGL